MKQEIPAALAAIGLLLGLTACAEKVALSGMEVSGSLPVLAVGGSAPVELAYSFTRYSSMPRARGARSCCGCTLRFSSRKIYSNPRRTCSISFTSRRSRI